MSPGDFIKVDWFGRGKTYELCLVLAVHPPPNYHSGIDMTLEVLTPEGKLCTYDVYRGQNLEVLTPNVSR